MTAYKYPALKELANKLQFAEFGTEFTLDISSGTVEESDTLGVEELIYAYSPVQGEWELEYSTASLPDNVLLRETLYESANFMSYGTLWNHLGDLDKAMNASKLIVSLSIVDSHDCEDCDEYGTTVVCDHTLGWAVVSAILP